MDMDIELSRSSINFDHNYPALQLSGFNASNHLYVLYHYLGIQATTKKYSLYSP